MRAGEKVENQIAWSGVNGQRVTATSRTYKGSLSSSENIYLYTIEVEFSSERIFVVFQWSKRRYAKELSKLTRENLARALEKATCLIYNNKGYLPNSFFGQVLRFAIQNGVNPSIAALLISRK